MEKLLSGCTCIFKKADGFKGEVMKALVIEVTEKSIFYQNVDSGQSARITIEEFNSNYEFLENMSVTDLHIQLAPTTGLERFPRIWGSENIPLSTDSTGHMNAGPWTQRIIN